MKAEVKRMGATLDLVLGCLLLVALFFACRPDDQLPFSGAGTRLIEISRIEPVVPGSLLARTFPAKSLERHLGHKGLTLGANYPPKADAVKYSGDGK
jgi:hypothetical protein